MAVVTLKQPFVDWVNSIEKPYGKLTLEQINRENHVYLLPEHDTQQQLEQILQNIYQDIFEVELQSFCRDESIWHNTLHYKTFLRWFDIRVHTMVFDPYDDEIVQEEYFGG